MGDYHQLYVFVVHICKNRTKDQRQDLHVHMYEVDMYLYGCDFSVENTLCTMFRSSCKNALHIVLYYTEVLHECNANQNQRFP